MKDSKNLITKKLLQKSENDFNAAKNLFTFEDYSADVIFFHCQQAIEKVLKAYIDYEGEKFDKTHDIGKLLYQAITIDKDFNEINYISDLTPYAVEFRYDEVVEASKAEVEETIKRCKEAIKFVKEKIVLSI